MNVFNNKEAIYTMDAGIYLIEASAGTGKTYIASILYINFLLNLFLNKKNNDVLNIKNILLVTFTKLAAKELKKRIYKLIFKLKRSCLFKNKTYKHLKFFLNKKNNIDIIFNKILLIENKIKVYTIHGFCKLMLSKYLSKFENFFQFSILKNKENFYKKIIYNFWNNIFHKLPKKIIYIILSYWKNDKIFSLEIINIINQNINLIKIKNLKYSISEYYKKNLEDIENIKKQWKIHSNTIETVLLNSKINKYIYNAKNIRFWINKINIWINKETKIDYIPKELERFKYSNIFNNLKNVNNILNIFNIIDNFYNKFLSFRIFFLCYTLKKIELLANKEKLLCSKFDLDDFIIKLHNNLYKKNGKKISSAIRKEYPIAIIDEFQDTDIYQYKIFKKIYNKKKYCKLILIGDPKQLIYSFRGANINYYLNIKKKINNFYNLNINWRSTKNLIKSTNTIFLNVKHPFLFRNLKFIPTLPSIKNINKTFLINNKIQKSMNFILYLTKEYRLDIYKNILAKKCAKIINNWLNLALQNKIYFKENNKNIKILTPSDIVILVRDKHESNIIQNALSLIKIKYKCITKNINIFETKEAKEILIFLTAVLHNNEVNLIRRALITELVGFTIKEIYNINNNKNILNYNIKLFCKYLNIWKTKGLFKLLNLILIKFNFKNKNLINNKIRSKLKNFLYLSEILYKKSLVINNEYIFLQWFIKQIKNSSILNNYKLKNINYQKNLIKIITIHKSKGLEFPIVFLPFASSLNYKKNNLINNINNTINFSLFKKNIIITKKHYLSDNLRLLYVALTRAIYYCCVGIYFNSNNNISKKDKYTISAINFLIQKGKNSNLNSFKKNIIELIKKSKRNIFLSEIKF